MMKNEVKVEDSWKELKKDETENSLNKQVLVCINLETMHLVFKKNWR